MEVAVVTRLVPLLVLVFVPALAHAQAPPTGRWDIAGTAGLFAGHTPRTTDGAGYHELWFHSVQGGVTLGRYFTPHLKLELEGSASTRGKQYRERLVAVPGYPFPYPIGSEAFTSVRSLSAALVWQFRENEWLHPFAQAGVGTDFDRVSIRTWEQFYNSDPRAGTVPLRVGEERNDEATTTHVRGVLGGGAKIYFTPRAFVRTDGRWTFDRRRQNLVMRIGVGVDF
jgi:opacity protein-like surface antigen